MKNKKIFLLLLIIMFIFGFALSSFLNFYFFSFKNDKKYTIVNNFDKTTSPTIVREPIGISPSITPFPSFSISKTLSKNNKSDLPIFRIPYQKREDWLIYTDLKGGFSFQYDANPKEIYNSYYRIFEYKEGEYVILNRCFTYIMGRLAGVEDCSQTLYIKIYYNYNGGSRREWFMKNINTSKECDTSLYLTYYADIYLGNNKGLLYTSECNGPFGATYLLFPKGNKMIVISKDGHLIDLDKKEIVIKKDDFFINNILSTFELH